MDTKRECGFTLTELLIVVAILAILSAIAVSLYTATLEKARLTSSVEAISAMRRYFEIYNNDHSSYPVTLNLADFTDSNGDAVMDQAILTRLKQNLYSIDSYSSDGTTYELKAKAIDAKNTPIVLTPTKISY